jgi:hypothetical protein
LDRALVVDGAMGLEELKAAVDVPHSTTEFPRARISPSRRIGNRLHRPNRKMISQSMRLHQLMWQHSAFKVKTQLSLLHVRIVELQLLHYGEEMKVVIRFAMLVVRYTLKRDRRPPN